MGKQAHRRLRPLATELARVRGDIEDPAAAIAAGEVLVDGRIVTNPRSLVRADASIVVRPARPLRGELKLAAALDAFGLGVAGVAVDAGAAAGGFTRELLRRGARRVYAVDAGFGQLRGSLRADPRVVNLEGVNIAGLSVPDRVDVVTLDLSYLSLAAALPQLERLRLSDAADLVALVKPMYELGLAAPPQAHPERAIPLVCAAAERLPWRVRACMRSPVPGARGARELFVWARRC